MKFERVKNAKRNVLFGIALRLYQIVLPFIMRTIIVYALGVHYLGLNGLFTSILQVLNLAELGVGSAMVFSMYKPIAEDDSVMICALMRLYRSYYRIIGLVVLALGLLLLPFIPRLITGEVPADINLYVLYLLNLAATVLTYWLFAYRNSVLDAHQRQDVISKVTIITDTLKYALQIFVLFAFHNYYYYVICILVSQIIANCYTAYKSKQLFPEYDPKGELPESNKHAINRRIKDLFTARFGGVILTAGDNIVISAFLGLEMLAVFQNYYYVLSAVLGIIMVINNSVVAGFGNSMYLESLDENYKHFERFSFIEFWIMGFCVCSFSVLYQPFMEIWMGKDLMFSNSMIPLFCIYFVGYQFEKMMSVFKDAGGIWHEDRYRPLSYGLGNLALNIILVQYIGIYGVLLSTIISVFIISIPWITNNVFKLIYHRSPKPYLLQLLKYSIVILISVLLVNLTVFVPINNVVMTLLFRMLICLVVPNLVYYLAFRHLPEFEWAKGLVKR